MRFSLPSIKCSAVPPSFRLLPSARQSNRWAQFRQHSRKLGGVAEQLIDGSEKRICRLSFEFQSPHVIEKRGKCDLCDADYVGFTSRHLHQRVEEHKRSVIGNHVREQHGNDPCEIAKNFRVLRKCSNKFECLIFEMFFIRDLKPKLNKQSDSICAALFA